MRPKPTREAVEETLSDFEAHELIGSRRDVYELVVNVFKDWLAQEEELEIVESEKHTMCQSWEKQNRIIEQLQTENQALKASMEAEYVERQAKHIQALVGENEALKVRVEAIIQTIKDEPELPGPMPNEMLNDIEKAGIEETMRVVVRETKRGILRRIKP